LQLAAALIWAGAPVEKDEFVYLDEILREAARNEGFVVLPKTPTPCEYRPPFKK
jgi:hypothetical protein